MILKALKILPILTGVTSTPILNTPKKANENLPIEVFDQDLYYDDHLLDDYTSYEEDGITKRTAKMLENSASYNNEFATFDIRFFTEDYYIEKGTPSQTYIWENRNGKTQYHSCMMNIIHVSNITGYNKITFTSMYNRWAQMLNHALNPTLTQEEHIYVITNITEGGFYWYTDIEEGHVLYAVNDIKNNYQARQINSWKDQVEVSYNLNDDEQLSIGNYYVNEGVSTDYYFIHTVELYYSGIGQNMILTSYRNIDVATINLYYTIQDYVGFHTYFETYATEIVQEVVDIPNVMFTVLTMPFSFYSQAFNLTLFPGTQYSFNVGNFFICLLAILMFAWVLKIIIGFVKK